MTASLSVDPRARFGWMSERSVWLYLATLWLGGAKIFFGTFRAFAEVGDEVVVFRPLHQIGRRAIAWAAVRGTEQMIGGDRLIVYYDTPRGLRFVALNLNLVKGRRDLLALLDERLRSEGFVERIVGPSRYLSRVDSQTGAAAGDGS